MKKYYVVLFLLVSTLGLMAQTKHIRWGSNINPLNGLTITWRGVGSTDKIKWGYTAAYENGEFLGTVRAGYTDKISRYEFPSPVTPNATIYYQIYDSNTSAWSAAKTFHTSPPQDTTQFSFLAVGDSRDQMNIWSQIATLANNQNTNFTIYNGDIVASGALGTDWDKWFDNAAPYIENNLIFHALGNHDALSVPTYQNLYELPKSVPVTGTTLYYAVTYGNAVFITLNSENPTDATQNAWLISTLQANADKTWKIVSFHKPFYTIGTHAGEMNSYFTTWWKAFDDYGVNLILNGHDHMYERTKPINRLVSTTAPVTTYGNGTGQGRCEIVCGGAGAPLYTGTTTAFIQVYQSKYNFVKFTVNGNQLCGTAIDNTGATIDTFCLTSTLGVNENTISFYPIKIAPNPVKKAFNFTYKSPNTGAALVTIYDMTVKEVFSQTVNKDADEMNFTSDLSNLPKGVYNLMITMGNQKDNSYIVLE